MGDMSDYELQLIVQNEADAEEFLDGNMDYEEAMDRGFISPDGTFPDAMHEMIDRLPGPMSEKTVDYEIARYELMLNQHEIYPARPGPVTRVSGRRSSGEFPAGLSSAAVKNLSKAVPTCNICQNPMTPRNGRFGKFYFCECPGQVTVSDDYWQKIKSR